MNSDSRASRILQAALATKLKQKVESGVPRSAFLIDSPYFNTIGENDDICDSENGFNAVVCDSVSVDDITKMNIEIVQDGVIDENSVQRIENMEIMVVSGSNDEIIFNLQSENVCGPQNYFNYAVCQSVPVDNISIENEIVQDVINDVVIDNVEIMEVADPHEEVESGRYTAPINKEIQEQEGDLDFDAINSMLDPEESEINNKEKRKKRENMALQQKLKKQRGEAHLSKSKKCISQKMLQPSPCKDKCQNGCNKKFEESSRLKIFNDYWALDETEKRNFVLSCMEMTDKNRTYKNEKQFGKSRRGVTYKYTLNSNDGKKVRVCLQFLLKTLNVSHKLFSYTFKHKSDLGTAKLDKRGRKVPPNKTPELYTALVKKFIESLPAVPSHYCRSDSNKIYLPAEFRSKANIFRIYKNEFCVRENTKAVSEKVFTEILRKQYSNIGIHAPKKDKCIICEGSKEADKESESYAQHIHEKKLSISMFKAHQIRSKTDPTFLCVSFDLQKVLNTPHGDNMLLYYTRKYAMYNFTLYESGTRNGFCYIWGECDGKRGANEMCSNVFSYLTDLENRNPEVKIVSLFCDSCPGQNKNRQMLAMLHFFVQQSKTLQEIQITYLLPGHTYMPADSMHSVIESNYRKKIIWAPSEWPTIITNSRFNPKPYEVSVLSFNDFQDWKLFQEKTLTNAGQVRRMKRAIVRKREDHISIFYCYDNSGSPLNIRMQGKTRKSSNASNKIPKTVYTSRLPISELKKKDLMTLFKKKVIPSRYHAEFMSLPSNKKVVDFIDAEVENDDETASED